MLDLGCSNKGIGERLFISENTVKVHLRNVNAKLAVAAERRRFRGSDHRLNPAAVALVRARRQRGAMRMAPSRRTLSPLNSRW